MKHMAYSNGEYQSSLIEKLSQWCWSILIILLLSSLSYAGPNGTLKVHFIDIGQGDSALIESPTGKLILIDSGPSKSKKALDQYLNAHGVKQLDLLINTHPHSDHIGNAAHIVKKYTVKTVLDSGFTHPIRAYQKLLDVIEEQKTPLKLARRGRKIEIGGGARLEIYAPELPFISGARSDPNANSIIFKLIYKKQSFLFTGDAEEETEERLLSSDLPLNATVLKVAHHGSKHASSNQFLSAVNPQYAVISCSDRNRYGHPAPETLSRLNKRGIATWVTAEGGTIMLETDGLEWKWSSAKVKNWAKKAKIIAHTDLQSQRRVSKGVTDINVADQKKNQAPNTHLIAVNQADHDELIKLPGIGPTLAKRIIKARPFATAEDLLRVKGIGKKKLAKISPLIHCK